MNQLTDTVYTAYVGIDWAAAKHDICVQAAEGGFREFDCISSQPEGIESWALDLYRRFGGPIAVALELSKGPIVTALQKYDFMVLYPINPLQLARYREAFTPSGAKDDPTDAELAHLSLHMRRGAMVGHVEQHLFIAPGRHPRHGPYLGVTHFTLAKRSQDFRQCRQSAGDACPLTSGAHTHAAFPVQPIRTGGDAGALPAAFFIENRN